jgi:hypothetical protein
MTTAATKIRKSIRSTVLTASPLSDVEHRIKDHRGMPIGWLLKCDKGGQLGWWFFHSNAPGADAYPDSTTPETTWRKALAALRHP